MIGFNRLQAVILIGPVNRTDRSRILNVHQLIAVVSFVLLLLIRFVRTERRSRLPVRILARVNSYRIVGYSVTLHCMFMNSGDHSF